ncbi:MAG: hypothetical protein D6721_06795 [Gammaproteobacteria bacterium]|nr:MAG: hypothetical protein D6721_06795 [Gammaproteobacteria bacterium]
MEIVKKSAEYTIYKKRNGRMAVKNAERKWVNGEEKVKILLAEGLIRLDPPKPKPEAEEAPAEGDAG